MAKKKKIKVDGKEYDLSEFDDRHYWTKNKKNNPRSNTQMMPNILGKV